MDGFVLHAGRTVAAGDRKGLEQLCRYGLRSPISQERLSLLSDGKVLYRLKRPWPTDRGVTEIVWEPKKFLRRLAALVPFPYTNMVRYHGVFANRSRDRFRLPPPKSWASEAEGGPPAEIPMISGGGQAVRPRRLGWARLLKRVLQVDALTCARCSAAMVVIAFITDLSVCRRILEHLKLPSRPREIKPARIREEEEWPVDEGRDEEEEGEGGGTPPGSALRGPP